MRNFTRHPLMALLVLASLAHAGDGDGKSPGKKTKQTIPEQKTKLNAVSAGYQDDYRSRESSSAAPGTATETSQQESGNTVMLGLATYRFRMPKTNPPRKSFGRRDYDDEIRESELQVGGSFSQSEMESVATTTSGSPSVCVNDQTVYQMNKQSLSGKYAVVRGLRLGNGVFFYGLLGLETGAKLQKTSTQDPGNSTVRPEDERWWYIGPTGEAGVGFRGEKSTTMIGAYGRAMVTADKAATALPENGDNHYTDRTVGLKLRHVGENVVARGSVTAGTRYSKPAGYSNLLQYGCEVLIRMPSEMLPAYAGLTFSGESVDGTGLGSAASPGMVSDAKRKTGSLGVKVVVPFGGRKKRSPAGPSQENVTSTGSDPLQ